MARTGRRAMGALDAWLEQWARWLASPDCAATLGGGPSLLARWMDARGQIVFGSGSGSSVPADARETRIELEVLRIGRANQLREDVLRLEYDAGWWLVVNRRGLRGYDPRGATGLTKALHLGISLRTYRTRLAEARAELVERLERGVCEG